MTPRQIIERLVTALAAMPGLVESRHPFEVFPGEDTPGDIEGRSFAVGVLNTTATPNERQNRANRGSFFETTAVCAVAVRIRPHNARADILAALDVELDAVKAIHACDRSDGFVIDIPQIGPREYDETRKIWTTRITVRCLTLYPLAD